MERRMDEFTSAASLVEVPDSGLLGDLLSSGSEKKVIGAFQRILIACMDGETSIQQMFGKGDESLKRVFLAAASMYMHRSIANAYGVAKALQQSDSPTESDALPTREAFLFLDLLSMLLAEENVEFFVSLVEYDQNIDNKFWNLLIVVVPEYHAHFSKDPATFAVLFTRLFRISRDYSKSPPFRNATKIWSTRYTIHLATMLKIAAELLSMGIYTQQLEDLLITSLTDIASLNPDDSEYPIVILEHLSRMCAERKETHTERQRPNENLLREKSGFLARPNSMEVPTEGGSIDGAMYKIHRKFIEAYRGAKFSFSLSKKGAQALQVNKVVSMLRNIITCSIDYLLQSTGSPFKEFLDPLASLLISWSSNYEGALAAEFLENSIKIFALLYINPSTIELGNLVEPSNVEILTNKIHGRLNSGEFGKVIKAFVDTVLDFLGAMYTADTYVMMAERMPNFELPYFRELLLKDLYLSPSKERFYALLHTLSTYRFFTTNFSLFRPDFQKMSLQDKEMLVDFLTRLSCTPSHGYTERFVRALVEGGYFTGLRGVSFYGVCRLYEWLGRLDIAPIVEDLGSVTALFEIIGGNMQTRECRDSALPLVRLILKSMLGNRRAINRDRVHLMFGEFLKIVGKGHPEFVTTVFGDDGFLRACKRWNIDFTSEVFLEFFKQNSGSHPQEILGFFGKYTKVFQIPDELFAVLEATIPEAASQSVDKARPAIEQIMYSGRNADGIPVFSNIIAKLSKGIIDADIDKGFFEWFVKELTGGIRQSRSNASLLCELHPKIEYLTNRRPAGCLLAELIGHLLEYCENSGFILEILEKHKEIPCFSRLQPFIVRRAVAPNPKLSTSIYLITTAPLGPFSYASSEGAIPAVSFVFRTIRACPGENEILGIRIYRAPKHPNRLLRVGYRSSDNSSNVIQFYVKFNRRTFVYEPISVSTNIFRYSTVYLRPSTGGFELFYDEQMLSLFQTTTDKMRPTAPNTVPRSWVTRVDRRNMSLGEFQYELGSITFHAGETPPKSVFESYRASARRSSSLLGGRYREELFLSNTPITADIRERASILSLISADTTSQAARVCGTRILLNDFSGDEFSEFLVGYFTSNAGGVSVDEYKDLLRFVEKNDCAKLEEAVAMNFSLWRDRQDILSAAFIYLEHTKRKLAVNVFDQLAALYVETTGCHRKSPDFSLPYFCHLLRESPIHSLEEMYWIIMNPSLCPALRQFFFDISLWYMSEDDPDQDFFVRAALLFSEFRWIELMAGDPISLVKSMLRLYFVLGQHVTDEVLKVRKDLNVSDKHRLAYYFSNRWADLEISEALSKRADLSEILEYLATAHYGRYGQQIDVIIFSILLRFSYDKFRDTRKIYLDNRRVLVHKKYLLARIPSNSVKKYVIRTMIETTEDDYSKVISLILEMGLILEDDIASFRTISRIIFDVLLEMIRATLSPRKRSETVAMTTSLARIIFIYYEKDGKLLKEWIRFSLSLLGHVTKGDTLTAFEKLVLYALNRIGHDIPTEYEHVDVAALEKAVLAQVHRDKKKVGGILRNISRANTLKNSIYYNTRIEPRDLSEKDRVYRAIANENGEKN